MTTFATTVVIHTPPWVWGLLALLIALGLRQSRDHVLGRGRLLAMPAVMTVLSLVGASTAFGAHPFVLAAWALGLVLGIGAVHGLRLPIRAQALPRERFAVGGSWWPLALMLGVFALRYVVTASLVVAPALAHEMVFALTASLAYGALAGLFGGRALRVLAQAPKGAVPLAA